MVDGQTGRLHRAARAGDLAKCKEYFKTGAMKKAPGDVNKLDEKGNTALLLATAQSSIPVVEFLLAQKADVNQSNERGVTPLMAAANHGRVDVADLLFKNGKVDVAPRNCDGYTAFLIAAELGHVGVLNMLRDKGVDPAREHLPNGATPLMMACSTGNLPVAEFSVAAGCSVNDTMMGGDTPLMIAAVHNHVRLVTFLAEHGADLNVLNRDGRSVLALCTDLGLHEMCEELRRLGCTSQFPSTLMGSAKYISGLHCVAPCVMFGSNVEMMEFDCCCWCCFYSALCVFTPIAPCCLAARIRETIRIRYDIPGSTAGDYAAHIACHCCALAQERELLQKCAWRRDKVRAPTITTPEEIGAYHKMG